MMHLAAAAIAEDFARKSIPAIVQYAPRIRGDAVIVESLGVRVDRDWGASEPIVGPASFKTNGRKLRDRVMAGWAKVYARSELEGARQLETEFVCDALVDATICALHKWAVAERLGAGPSFTEARYLRPEEREAEHYTGGLVYLLRFTLPRGVSDATRPTAIVHHVATVLDE